MWESPTISQIFYLTFILSFPQAIFAREEWRDPHDMHIKVQNYREKTNHDECHCPDHNEKEYFCLMELISKIVSTVNYRRDTETYEGQLKITLNKEDYDFLETIRSGDRNFQLRRFSQVLKNSVFIERYPIIFTLGEYIFLWLHNEYLWLAVCVIGTLFLLWKLQPHKYTFTMLFKLFLPLVYISDFVLRYQALLEEVEIDKYMDSRKYTKCDPEKLGWFDWLYDKVTGYCDTNERNMLLSRRESMHIITPMKVLTQQFDVLIPFLKYLGEGFGKFIYAVVVESPWYVKPVMLLFAFILVIIILLMMGARLFQISPKFNCLHLISFDFRLNDHPIMIDQPQQQKDCVSGENLKLLLESKNPTNNTILLDNPGHSTARVAAPTFKTKKRIKDVFRRKPYQTLTPSVVNQPSVSKECKPDEEVCKSQTGDTKWSCWPGGDQPFVIRRRQVIEFD